MAKQKSGSARGRRILKKRLPQIVEGEKRLLALRGPCTNEIAVAAMKDLVCIIPYLAIVL